MIPHAPIHRTHQESVKSVSNSPITESVSKGESAKQDMVPEKIQIPTVPSQERNGISRDEQSISFSVQHPAESCNPSHVSILPSDTDLTVTAFFLFTSFVIVVTFSFEVCYFGISVLSSRLVFVSSPFSLE